MQTFYWSHRPVSGIGPKHKQTVWQNFGQLAGMLAINGFLWLCCGQNNESVMTEKQSMMRVNGYLSSIASTKLGNQHWDWMIFSNLWSDVSSQYIAFGIISGKVTLIGIKTNGHFLKHLVLNGSPNFFAWQGNDFNHSCQLYSFVFFDLASCICSGE